MSLPLYTAAAVPIAIILVLISIWWDRRWRLRNVPYPVCPGGPCFIFRDSPWVLAPLQAGASLVWGHEKTEFEDDQGWQWRAWFNECGRAFKMKGAWGHPDIVRTYPPVLELLQC